MGSPDFEHLAYSGLVYSLEEGSSLFPARTKNDAPAEEVKANPEMTALAVAGFFGYW